MKIIECKIVRRSRKHFIFITASKLFAILLLTLSFSGCATYFNDPYQSVTIHTKPEGALVVMNSDTSHSNLFIVSLPRSTEDVELQVINGEKKKTVSLKSTLSKEFIFGNIILPPGLGWSHFIDYCKSKDSKINSYDTEIFVDMNDTINNYFRWGFPENNYQKFAVKFSLPEGNFHKLNTQTVKSSTRGFLGLTGELDYYYSTDQYFSLTTGITLQLPPLPGAYNPPDSLTSISTLFFSIQNNHDFDTWELGYGLSCSRYFYKESNLDYQISKWFNGVGLSFSASRRIFRTFQVGINYLPTFILFDRNATFGYSHVIYFDLKFTLFEN